MKKCPSQAPPCHHYLLAPCRGPISVSRPPCLRTRGALAAQRHSALLARGPCFSCQDTVSVHRPSFYAERFFKFMSNTVFRKNSCELPRPFGQEGPRVRSGEAGWPSLGLSQGLGPENRVVRTPPSWGLARGLGPAV